MPSLVRANIFQRKMRAAITIMAVAIEVMAVLLIVGLTNGTLDEIAQRMEAVGADILVQPAGSSPIIGLSGTTLLERYADVLADVEGVAGVAPIFIWSAQIGGGAPVNVWGIDEGFAEVGASLDILEGSNLRAPSADGANSTSSPAFEMVVDRRFADANDVVVGQSLRTLETDWEIVGIARSGLGARIYAPLVLLQDLVGQPGRVHLFFVKAERLDRIGELGSRIEAEVPGVQTTVLEDYAQSLNDNITGLNAFRGAISGIAVVLSFLVILLAMYTSIIERTREIGILKALGGSKLYIVLTIMQESMLLSALGVVGGYGLGRLSAAMLTSIYPTLIIEFSWDWTIYAGILGIIGGVLGSFYPAVRAARLDPVNALRDE